MIQGIAGVGFSVERREPVAKIRVILFLNDELLNFRRASGFPETVKMPTVTDFDQDLLAIIETGDYVRVDGDNGIVEVTKRR
jgi:hypothetical protein